MPSKERVDLDPAFETFFKSALQRGQRAAPIVNVTYADTTLPMQAIQVQDFWKGVVQGKDVATEAEILIDTSKVADWSFSTQGKF